MSLNKKLLEVYSPKNCLKFSQKVSTIEKAINSKAPTIGTLKREKGIDFTTSLVMLWLVYLNAILNLNKPMTEDQIEICAQEIVNEFYALKISDITLLFKRIMSGEYGEFYESLSVQKVLSYFRMYFDERCKYAESESVRKNLDFKSDETFNISKNIQRILKKK